MPGRSGRRSQSLDDPGPRYGIVGESPAVRDLVHHIERVGPTEAGVLILGERGTGKELVARALVATSSRRARPFFAINCAALPTELLASELFGHERGAFTGATERRPGLLAAAQGGTVFLDEVGDLSPAGQAMLLRFLQEREVRPVGATAAFRVDVRVIAATNRDLDRAIAAGVFRHDLHDRLAEMTLTVRPLRDRVEDIPVLVEHFLALHAQRHGRPAPRLGPEALRALVAAAWPGNVRELEKAISRAVIFAEDGRVRVEDLGVPIAGQAMPGTAAGVLTGRQREVLRLAVLRGSVRRRDVIERFGLSGEAARRELMALVRLGALGRVGERRGSRYFIAGEMDS